MAKNDLNKLTASFLAGLKKFSGQDLPEGMPLTYPDGGGLSLVYRKDTKKFHWNMKYRIAGKEKRTSYGVFPDVTLAQARAHREHDRALIAQQIDPVEQRRAEEQKIRDQALTYEKIARQWHAQTTVNPKTFRTTLQMLELHVFPSIGRIPFSQVERRQLADVLQKVARQIGRNGGPKAYTAKKLCSFLSQIDDFGEAKGLIPANRCLRLSRALPSLPTGGFAAVISPPEVASMLKAFTAFYHGKNASPYMRAAIRLIPYMAFRPGLLIGARWDEIDLDQSLCTVDAEPMRTKWTQGRKFFPLPMQVVKILKEVSSLRDKSDYIFPGYGKTGHLRIEGLEVAHRKIVHGLGLNHTVHGWRKVFSTYARENGAPKVLSETTLAHVSGGQVENVYNKASYLEPRRVLVQWYADYLDALEAGNPLPALPQINGFALFEA